MFFEIIFLAEDSWNAIIKCEKAVYLKNTKFWSCFYTGKKQNRHLNDNIKKLELSFFIARVTNLLIFENILQYILYIFS